ncbi:hypothetical protein DPMN_154114 [Dreissena polymorpha]|uniref:Uncharacterized protein n=1 Tax=Dreissena polymorpha TaxID=45954 RepID=A0A9D4J5F2_DREPO|nr:hypothetical protein DPMN_154114 [Dreissena polymorpha]
MKSPANGLSWTTVIKVCKGLIIGRNVKGDLVLKRFTFIQNTKCILLRGNFHKNGMLEPLKSTKVNNCSAGCPFQQGTTCEVQRQWAWQGQ